MGAKSSRWKSSCLMHFYPLDLPFFSPRPSSHDKFAPPQSKMGHSRHFGTITKMGGFEGSWGKIAHSFSSSWRLKKNCLLLEFIALKGVRTGYGWKPRNLSELANMCTVSRLERQVATLYLFQALPPLCRCPVWLLVLEFWICGHSIRPETPEEIKIGQT